MTTVDIPETSADKTVTAEQSIDLTFILFSACYIFVLDKMGTLAQAGAYCSGKKFLLEPVSNK